MNRRERRCECGRCRACAWAWHLGATPNEAEVVHALLDGPATLDALRLETQLGERSLMYALAQLRRVGRVVVERGIDERSMYRLRSTPPARSRRPPS